MDHIRKLFARIPKKHRLQIEKTIACLLNPKCAKTVKAEKLSGSDRYKVRSGRYRIIFHKDGNNDVIVDDIRLRDESTYSDI